MLKKEIPYKNAIIEQWLFGTKTFFYPNFNGNAEFTDFRKCCSYIKTFYYFNNLFETYFRIETNDLKKINDK